MFGSNASLSILLLVGLLFGQARPMTPRDFAVRLATNGVSGAVVVPESEFVGTGPLPRPDPGGPAVFRKALPNMVEGFNGRHTQVWARIGTELTNIEASALPAPVEELLSRRVFVDETQRVSLGDAIFKRLVGFLRHQPVTALAGVGIMPGPSCRLNQPVALPRGERTTRQYLNELAAQIPGLVWVITFDVQAPDHALKIGVVCPGGESLRIRVTPS